MNCLIQSEYVGGFWRCWGCGVIGFQGSDTTTPRARDPMPGVTDLVSGALGEPHDEKIRVYLGIAQTVIGSHIFCFFLALCGMCFSQKIRKFLKQ